MEETLSALHQNDAKIFVTHRLMLTCMLSPNTHLIIGNALIAQKKINVQCCIQA